MKTCDTGNSLALLTASRANCGKVGFEPKNDVAALGWEGMAHSSMEGHKAAQGHGLQHFCSPLSSARADIVRMQECLPLGLQQPLPTLWPTFMFCFNLVRLFFFIKHVYDYHTGGMH